VRYRTQGILDGVDSLFEIKEKWLGPVPDSSILYIKENISFYIKWFSIHTRPFKTEPEIR
jgi:hypothetical protein